MIIQKGLLSFPSDKPATPTLTTSNSNPTDGEAIDLTCTSSSAGVNLYQFFRDGQAVGASQSSGTLSISTATIDTHDGSYTCTASINTVTSDESPALPVAREYSLFLCVSFAVATIAMSRL